ncbi:hypothetical protein Q8A64_16030 [Oxalobacteraceae bacterium R-40]|uniref:Ribbon-helix-helix CopG family protein n=1 Tax=Keguizhuia sedimenti TaxID=3064264 RepID=A0ABU1BUF9_9BURK|nr:hypothetical protein [Oxalobacteraceae bacterium R-40]
MSEKVNPVEAPKTKRGRKPLGERALTQSELKRRSREKLAQQGGAEFMVRLDKGLLNLVDQIAAENEVTRSQVVENLLHIAMNRFVLGLAEAEQLHAAGASQGEVAAKLRSHFNPAPAPEFLEKYKEVRGL